MSRSASFEVVSELVTQSLRVALVTTLFASVTMSAMARESGDANPVLARNSLATPLTNVNFTKPAPAGNYAIKPMVRSLDYAEPALAGNYPDPSVIRVGQDYWATATSSGWAPQFPIIHSRDLVNWKIVGSVFQERPAWSDGNYWAPEISHYRDRYFVYYVGRKIDGPRCVAVATASSPTGPYTDHGPLVCQNLGSIDPMAVTDEHGWRYLVWKEGGNSHDLPTPIWAQRLSGNGLRLIGNRTELIHNDVSWEAKVVEGPFILRHGGWFYMFYSGNDCCDIQCDYALGVARSPYLLGPWEKNPVNPILKGSDTWKCPGHGSVVSDAKGHDYLLYHAFRKDSIYVGRQALLGQVRWNADQWPTINAGVIPDERALSPRVIEARNAEYSFDDDFTSRRLTPGWQWPQANEPSTRIEQARKGWLALSSTNVREHDVIGAIVAQATTVGNYVATTAADTSGMKRGALAGLAAYGDGGNALGIAVGHGRVIVWKRESGEQEILATIAAPKSALVQLRMTAMGGRRFRFAVGRKGGDWKVVGSEKGSYLPPWDHAVRVALTSGGVNGAAAKFDWLRIVPSEAKHSVLWAGSK